MTSDAPREIPLAQIDVPAGRRKVDPDWVAALAADIEGQGLRIPILVVEAGKRFRLIAGAHRLGAAKLLRWKSIRADVKPADAFADEAALKLAEIAENLMRRELSALDRAMDVAAWREIYEQAQGAVKRGGNRRAASKFQLGTLIDADPMAVAAERFSAAFNEAAQRALGLGKTAVWRCLKIATLDADTRERVALSRLADNQSELIALADIEREMRPAVLDHVLSEPPMAGSVAAALGMIEGRKPEDPAEKAFRSFSDSWRRFPVRQRRAFVRAHQAEILAMLKEEEAL
ncbi:ParB/RepB/Spo0J family partition protein [Stappia sp. TSB10P1A]|uniref:ParB/RepB/Spo0J family partition protein n=1 Tax=Stappia sp. TSB10P1A TaxID=2003585 RepID=UPI001643B8DA|nr:ParB N-terminal domain-containing protein [Stappia sp. TSB10P1A]